ncbi:MAG: lipopolysaccharide biosynthesis protein [bacterium]
MSLTLVKNTSLYTVGNILPQVAGFLLLPVYTRYLTPKDYGIVSSMQVLMAITAVIFTLAMERSLYRLYWDCKTEQEKQEYLGTVAVALILIALIELGIIFVSRRWIGRIFVTIDFYPFYAYAILAMFFSVFSHIPKIHLQLEQRAGSFVFLSLIQFAVTTGLVLWFVVVRKSGAEGMLLGRMLGPAVLAGIFIYLTAQRIRFCFKPRILKETLAYSIPLVPTMLCAWILNLSDRIFIERYFSLEDVGIYSLGYKLGEIVLLISGGFGMAYNPIYFELANSPDQESARNRLFQYNNRFLMVVLLISFGICLFAKEAVVLFLDPRYEKAYQIVPFIVLAYFIQEVSHLLNLSIYQEKRTKMVMSIQMAGALMNIGMNFLLVPAFGAFGAAYATVLSFAGIFVLKYWYAKRCYFIPFKWRQLLCCIALLTGVVAAQYAIDINLYYLFALKLMLVLTVLAVFARRHYDTVLMIFAGAGKGVSRAGS